jgi:TonB family protein
MIKQYLFDKYFWLSLAGHMMLLSCWVLAFNSESGDIKKPRATVTTKALATYAYEQKTKPVLINETKTPVLRLSANKRPSQPMTSSKSSPAKTDKLTISEQAHASPSKNVLLTMLHELIAAKQHYPESALALNQTGSVLISFTLHVNGELTNIVLIKSSGITSIDSAALSAVKAISPVNLASFYLTKREHFSVEVAFIQ